MKPSRTRRQVAREAARLINEQPDMLHSDAKRNAAERLFPLGIHSRDIPTTAEVGEHLRSFHEGRQQRDWDSRFVTYAQLLHPLAEVKQDPRSHPEGDALYHSLQVFCLARETRDYDEELLTAALLHDVGKALDRRDPVMAGLDALAGIVTIRTAWFIQNLPVARACSSGALGVRARRRLKASEDYDELLILHECDSAGRMCGATVPDVAGALASLQQLSAICDEHSDDEVFYPRSA